VVLRAAVLVREEAVVVLRAAVLVREEAEVGLRAAVLVREEAEAGLRTAVLVREEAELVDVLFFLAVLFLAGMEPPFPSTHHDDDHILHPPSAMSYRVLPGSITNPLACLSRPSALRLEQQQMRQSFDTSREAV
jgi:hypothetical protein